MVMTFLFKYVLSSLYYWISDHFPKISEDSPKLFRRPDKHPRTFSNNFREFPKMSKDFRRLPKTFKGDKKMSRRYTNEFKYNLRDKSDITEIIDIFTCERSSHVRISYCFYQFVTTRYTTDFYIINIIIPTSVDQYGLQYYILCDFQISETSPQLAYLLLKLLLPGIEFYHPNSL